MLIGWSIKLLAVDKEEIQANEADPVMQAVEARVIRGSILDTNGKVLAYTEVGEEDGNEARIYPYGESAAHVVGYTGRGNSGLESALETRMLTSSDLIYQIASWVNDEKTEGNSVRVTIDADLQQFIYEHMDGYRGAVVVTEASTGATRALVSSPSFDPESLVDNWETIAEREDSPLYNRATQGLYAPGSTFKIIMALGMFRNMPGYLSYTYDCYGAYTVDDNDLYCAGSESHGTMDIFDAFAYSCNGFFASAGVNMGKEVIEDTAEYVGLYSDFDYPLPTISSTLGLDEYESEGMIAQTSIGQGKVTLTPLALNQLTAAIANGGAIYQPYLLEAEMTPNGTVVYENTPRLYSTVMTSAEAQFLETLMGGVIAYGTGSALYSEDYTVYGKTGTAQVEGQNDHSWFTGYVKRDGESDLVITVLIENGGYDKRAVPLVSDILDYLYD